jgi:hypothetical protein
MQNPEAQIPKSRYYQDEEAKKRIDFLLKESQSLYANIGNETSEYEIKRIDALNNAIFELITMIDPAFGKKVNPYGRSFEFDS